MILGALVCAGCGSSASFPRAAEPADSPLLTKTPSGTVKPLPRMPEGIVFVPGSRLLAVSLRDPDELAFVDPATLAVRRRVMLPASARHLAATGTEVVVPAEAADALLTVSTAGILTETAVGTHPHDAAVVLGSIFVADEHSDQVSVLRDGRLVTTLDAPQQPGGIAAVAGRYAALIAVKERVLAVYDGSSLEAVGQIDAGTGPTHIVAFGPDVYVADTQGDAVRQFQVGPEPREVGSAPVPGTPYGIAVDDRRHRLWVTLTASNELAELAIEGTRLRRVATYPTVRQPDSVAVDPRDGTVFVTGSAAGQLQRIEPRGGGSR